MTNKLLSEQYNDNLSEKIDRIGRMVIEKRITKSFATFLLSYYIKKELIKDVRKICKFDKKNTTKEFFFSYHSNKKDFYSI